MKMIGGLKLDLNNLSPEQSEQLAKEFAAIDSVILSSLKGELDFTDTETKIDAIFCERVDGYIPFSHNKGGHEITGMVLSLNSGIENCTDETAKDKMQEIVNDGEESVIQDLYKANQAELAEKNINSLEEFKAHLRDNDDEFTAKYNEEHDSYIDDEAVRFAIRVMFHGYSDGEFHFTVDAQINWEFPYFRDGKGCSAYKETEFSVKDSSELASVLKSKISEVKTLFKA